MSNQSRKVEERKQRALEAWINNPTKTYEQIADIAGISERTLYRYRQDEEFMSKYKAMCQNRFKQLEAKAIHKLNKQLDDDNFQAIKYTLDSLGYGGTNKIEAVNDFTISIGYGDDA